MLTTDDGREQRGVGRQRVAGHHHCDRGEQRVCSALGCGNPLVDGAGDAERDERGERGSAPPPQRCRHRQHEHREERLVVGRVQCQHLDPADHGDGGHRDCVEDRRRERQASAHDPTVFLPPSR